MQIHKENIIITTLNYNSIYINLASQLSITNKIVSIMANWLKIHYRHNKIIELKLI